MLTFIVMDDSSVARSGVIGGSSPDDLARNLTREICRRKLNEKDIMADAPVRRGWPEEIHLYTVSSA